MGRDKRNTVQEIEKRLRCVEEKMNGCRGRPPTSVPGQVWLPRTCLREEGTASHALLELRRGGTSVKQQDLPTTSTTPRAPRLIAETATSPRGTFNWTSYPYLHLQLHVWFNNPYIFFSSFFPCLRKITELLLPSPSSTAPQGETTSRSPKPGAEPPATGTPLPSRNGLGPRRCRASSPRFRVGEPDRLGVRGFRSRCRPGGPPQRRISGCDARPSGPLARSRGRTGNRSARRSHDDQSPSYSPASGPHLTPSATTDPPAVETGAWPRPPPAHRRATEPGPQHDTGYVSLLCSFLPGFLFSLCSSDDGNSECALPDVGTLESTASNPYVSFLFWTICVLTAAHRSRKRGKRGRGPAYYRKRALKSREHKLRQMAQELREARDEVLHNFLFISMA
jgi:hypothetical protein